MRTVSRLFSLAIIGFFLLLTNSCQKTSIQYGQQYIDNGITNVVLVDSLSPSLTTIYKDSVFTAISGAMLSGSYKDPYLGKISSDAYVQLAPPTLADLLPNAQYDSLVLLTKTNGFYYGDTTLPLSLSVRQLTQELKLAEGQAGFSNLASFPLDNSTLGTRSFVLRPLAGDSANIRLSDAKGLELFNMIRNKADILKDKALFTDYFKGLNIAATSNNNVYGFKDSVVMRLYYHQTDVGPENKFFDFPFDNTNVQFNHISADRTGTPLAGLNPINFELPSAAAGNMGYLQSATGIYLKIGFPTLRSLQERTDFVKIIRAQLVVRPILNSFNGLYPLPPVLYGAQTDLTNEPGSSITSVVNGTAATETGNLFIDAVYGANTSYTYDVTSYLQQEITNTTVNKNGLLLIPTADTRFANLQRLVVGDAKNLKNKLQLDIYYISVIK